jgi:hypothetical protein
VTPLVITPYNSKIATPNYDPVTFDPISLALGGGLQAGSFLQGTTLASVQSRIGAWNSVAGSDSQIQFGMDSWSGMRLGAGQSARFGVVDYTSGQSAGGLIFGAQSGGLGPIQSAWFGYKGDSGVTRLIGTSQGVGVYGGGNASFGGLSVSYAPIVAGSAGSRAPIIVNERAIFNAAYQRASAENGALLGRFLGDQIPFVGTGLAINDFRQNPSWMNGAMVGLSILPAAGTLSGLAKTSKTFNVGWEVPKEIGQANLVIHGNSASSTRTAYLYELYQTDGTFLKNGVTQNMSARYTNGFMENKFMREVTSGSRSDMLALELNREPWALKARGVQ